MKPTRIMAPATVAVRVSFGSAPDASLTTSRPVRSLSSGAR